MANSIQELKLTNDMANSIQDLTNYIANSIQDLTNYWYSKLSPRLNYTTNGKAKLLVQRLTFRRTFAGVFSGRRQGDRDLWLAGGRMDLRHRQAAEGDLVTLSSTAVETAIAGQWRGDTALTLPLFWRRSTVSPVFFGRFPRSSLHSVVPFPLCPRP